MQVLCSLYLSLKCANSENSFKEWQKETEYKYSREITQNVIWKPYKYSSN